MALALLRPAGRERGRLLFDIELGKNRFYSFAIGDHETDRSRGFEVLLNRKFTSEVFGPIADHPAGRASLEVPAELFDRDHRWLQLATFRTANRDGPAVSPIVMVNPGSVPRADEAFPDIPIGMGTDMRRCTQSKPVRLRYVEQPAISQAMFLGALLPIISKALPIVLPAIGGLLGGGGGAKGGNGAAAAPGMDQLLELLQKVLGQLAGAKSMALEEYSRAQNPALLAAAPAIAELMPLLKQVLSPETVKAVVDSVSPAKVIGAVTDSLKAFGTLGLENTKELQNWLAKLSPSVDDASLDKLLESMSLHETRALARSLSAPAARQGEPKFRRVAAVTLDFADVAALLVGGRTRICYRSGVALGFPLSVTTPRPIRQARLVMIVRNAATREVLLRQALPVPEVAGGPLSVVPTISAEQAAGLAPDQDYLVDAFLLWRDRRKQVLGTSRNQLITLVSRYSVDRVENDGALIPLNDVEKHRDYWHKIWQGDFAPERRRVVFECKYYTTLEPLRTENARIETTTRLGEPVERKLVGRLKSGFIASPTALNQLIPLVSSHPQLNEDELAVLRTPDFQERYRQAARFRAELHGRPGRTAALWVYPEIKMNRVVLFEATRVGDGGQVREFAEHPIHVPFPALLHYIGARTDS